MTNTTKTDMLNAFGKLRAAINNISDDTVLKLMEDEDDDALDFETLDGETAAIVIAIGIVARGHDEAREIEPEGAIEEDDDEHAIPPAVLDAHRARNKAITDLAALNRLPDFSCERLDAAVAQLVAADRNYQLACVTENYYPNGENAGLRVVQ